MALCQVWQSYAFWLSMGPRASVHQAVTSAWPIEVFLFMIQKPEVISERRGHLHLQVLMRMTAAGPGHLG